ncbi:MAG: metal-dependent transcriptional regulator [Thermogemmatispora sp.]|jgi:DtxR family Mn-dependent transcriptional regulator|uniref:DNA-binding protein n=1 Tax=Thermogemmatispora aurantia TaxID=2045279 RepID=A0A5J4K2L3_9CHLR|nr:MULTISPECIES: metal-dependent transcriptional regulator [Thermogemmatispora]MBE3565253.1 metal-dependent transcriptional regulator [Thermogemmatispora sp.]GER83108.1 DNA-binding protein [Thermogemmatispora aurantia]
MKTAESVSQTVEEYLETIYNMSMEGETVIGARLAQKFGVAPPTVTETLKRLVRDGYVEMDSRRQVRLTEAGYQIAESVLRRHRLAERFLVDLLGMEWHQVHEEACRLEHVISGKFEEQVILNLKQPTTCPHGNPIPGLVPNARTYLSDCGAVRLSALAPGETATILLISEVVEDESALILYLHQRGLTPGTRLTVVSQGRKLNPDDSEESVVLLVDGREVTIMKSIAPKIWVTR